MKRKYRLGEKVTPINKTPRIREHDNCGTYYRRLEENQDFLYIVGFDEEEEQRLNTPCYWCNTIDVIGGDSFAETDLIQYAEDNERMNKNVK